MTDQRSEQLWEAIEMCHLYNWTRERLIQEVNESWIETKRRELEAAEAAAKNS